MISLTQIILVCMDNNRSSNYGIFPIETGEPVAKTYGNISCTVRSQIAQISIMPDLAKRSSMVLVGRIIVRSCSCATFCEISELMNMNAMFSIWAQAFNSASDINGLANVFLTKRHYSSDIGVMRIKDAYCMPFSIRNLSLIKEKRRKRSGCNQGQYFPEHYQYDCKGAFSVILRVDKLKNWQFLIHYCSLITQPFDSIV